jgi:hypothetical protein
MARKKRMPGKRKSKQQRKTRDKLEFKKFSQQGLWALINHATKKITGG